MIMTYKFFKFPPFYIIGCPIYSFMSYWLFPSFKIVLYPYNLIGIVLIIGGWQIMMKAHKLFTKKATSFRLEKSAALITDSSFKFTRNPMYLGSLLIITGLSIFFGNVTNFISPVLFFMGINFICIPLEEKLLEKSFRNEYVIYKNRVRRWI